MIYFKPTLVKQAEDLLDIKSTKDDEKAAEEILQINNMIGKLEVSAEYLNSAMELDNRIKNEYAIIGTMINVANSMQIGSCYYSTRKTLEGVIKETIENLKSDKFGIMLDVLIKHKVVFEEKDFIEKVV